MNLFEFDVEEYLKEKNLYGKVFLGVPFMLSGKNGLSRFEHFERSERSFDDCDFEISEDTPFFLKKINFKKDGKTVCFFSLEDRDFLNYSFGESSQFGVLFEKKENLRINFNEKFYIEYSKDFSVYKTNMSFFSFEREPVQSRLNKILKRSYEIVEFSDFCFKFNSSKRIYEEIPLLSG